MKKERLLNAFGQIDDHYISEAAPAKAEHKAATKRKIMSLFRRPTAAAAALAICIGITGTTVLAATGVLEGNFSDIYNWTGAVVGTAYEQASDEIYLRATVTADNLQIQLQMLYPDKFPYRELDLIGIQNYKIVDTQGETVVRGNPTDMNAIQKNRAIATIPLEDLPQGSYTLVVSEMIGGHTTFPDSHLLIRGSWEYDFAKESTPSAKPEV